MRKPLALSLLFVAATLSSQQPATVPLFDAPVVVVDGFSRMDEVVDLDLDGDLDAAGIWFDSVSNSSLPIYLQLSMHENDGTGRFTKSVLASFQVSTGAVSAEYRSVVGDFDGDGHDDLFSTFLSTYCQSRVGGPVVHSLSTTARIPSDATLHAGRRTTSSAKATSTAMARSTSSPRPT